MANDAGVGGQVGFGFGEAVVEPLTREQRRSRRKREVRAKTISVKRLAKRDVEAGRMMYPEEDNGRPKTRGECPPPDEDGKRRCRFVSCEWHNYLDVSEKTGAIKLNYPDVEDPGDIPECCALDVADRGGTTLEEVGTIMNLTRERIRQLEVRAIENLPKWAKKRLRELSDGVPDGKRRLPLLQDPDGRERRATVAPGDADDELSDDDGMTMWGEKPMPRPADAGARAAMCCATAAFARVFGVNELPPVDRREAALLRAAERLRRAPATALLRLAGLGRDDAWILGPAVARGVIRREGDDVVWVGQQAAAE